MEKGGSSSNQSKGKKKLLIAKCLIKEKEPEAVGKERADLLMREKLKQVKENGGNG